MATDNKNDATRYDAICKEIERTDNISFQILGLVPLISAAGILGLLAEDKIARSPVIFLVSTFAAAVTFGFFRWELRNIQTCNWLRCRATLVDGFKLPNAPGRWGKTEAECLVYSSTMLAWLVLPWVNYFDTLKPWPADLTPLGMTHLIFLVLMLLLLALTYRDVPETKPPKLAQSGWPCAAADGPRQDTSAGPVSKKA